MLASLYEAMTIRSQLNCTKKKKDFITLWFLYIIAATNTLLVRQNCLEQKYSYQIAMGENVTVSELSGGPNSISKCPNIRGKRAPISLQRVPSGWRNKVKPYFRSFGSPCSNNRLKQNLTQLRPILLLFCI